MAFYLEGDERKKMMDVVKATVDNAVDYITVNFNKDRRYE